ncbi:hypothetical protein PFISCL1PPCAC_551, partial [Pristionchus fissidentatus]
LFDGRTRVFCFETDLIRQLGELPRDSFIVRDGLSPIENLDHFISENPDGFFSISLRLRGGKGGFGTLLKSFRINKSSNQLMCRDLSGRRLADIEEEKKLKKWIETTSEREKEKETKQKAKHEKLRAATRDKPKHDFNDPDYIKTREDILEKTDDAFEDGFKNLRKKRKPQQEELSSDESSDEEDTDQPGTSAATFKKPKRERVMPAEDSTSSSSPMEEDKSGSADLLRLCCRVVEEKPVETAPLPAPQVAVEPPKEEKKAYEKPTDIPTDFVPVDLETVAGVEELESLGLHHLKHALEARGLKCGGALQERAARLWSVKGLKKEEYPKAIVAPPPKNKK